MLMLTALTSGLLASEASGSSKSDWYWTPGWCKSFLHSTGVQINDGRTFHVQQAFCAGRGGLATCQWSNGFGVRRYNNFFVLIRSYDGTVRTFELHPTARDNFSVTGIRALGHLGLTEFDVRAGGLVAKTAAQAQALGCAKP
jgi:hypothetical protein